MAPLNGTFYGSVAYNAPQKEKKDVPTSMVLIVSFVIIRSRKIKQSSFDVPFLEIIFFGFDDVEVGDGHLLSCCPVAS